MFSQHKAGKWVPGLGLLCLIVLFTVSSAIPQEVRIMPFGDSLTEGTTDAGSDPAGGYRDDLYNMLTDDGIDFNFVGGRSLGDLSFDNDHEGHSGWSVDSLNLFLDTWLTSNTPDVVLFMGGTNDVYEEKTVTQIVNSIRTSIEKMYNYNSDIKIVMSSIIPRRDGLNDHTIEVNDELMNLYYEKLDAGYKIYYAGHFEMFTANENWAAEYMNQSDWIHPSNAGYAVMAQTYYNALMNALNPTSPIVTDNFNRPTLGDVWDAPSNYTIVNNELFLNTSDDGWKFLATYKGITNPTQVAMTISSSAPSSENQYWGLGVLLDAPSKSANGYLVRLIPDGLDLWTISNGSVSTSITTVDVGSVTLKPGDEFRVKTSTDGAGHHFDCYINNGYIGTISDGSKAVTRVDPIYGGIFLKGNISSTINSFDLFKTTDLTAPDAITDLAVSSATASTVTLSWTAVGDDGVTGNASEYDIRYSSAVISESNFAQSSQVSTTLVPSAPGTMENLVVTGLNSDTKYFFRIKTLDEAGNASEMSNSVDATTSNALGYTDDFERTELGSDWNAGSQFKITNGALENSSTESSWNNIAVFTQRNNPIEVSIKWDETADENGIGQGGLALMMSDNTPTASGYLIWRRSIQKIGLWPIIDGQLGPEAIGFFNAESVTPPQPGDTWKVVIRAQDEGNYFDTYINDEFDGTAVDDDKTYGTGENQFAGIVLHGGLNNNIESFTIVNTVGNAANLIEVSGNGQYGSVGRQLANPVVVKVTDKDGMAVSGYKVDFMVTEGGGSLDKAVATDGYIRFEAEDAELSGMYAEYDEDCSGDAYITGGSAGPDEASINFRFYISVAGTYYIWARVNPKGNYQQNSWYWKCDEGLKYIWDSLPIDADDWTWATIGDRGDSERERDPEYQFVAFEFDADWHNLTLYQMDANTKLDKILISNDISYNPPDGSKEEYPEYRTDGNGEATAYWTLGESYGTNNNKLRAESIGLTGSPIEFIASGLGDTPTNITLESGDGQTGSGGKKVGNPLVVKITDQYGNPNGGHPVTFTVTHGGGSMESTQPVLTNELGVAQDYFIAGTEDYTQTIEATSEVDGTSLTGSPVQFTFTATSNIATKMILAGDTNNQSGFVGDTLRNHMQVRIVGDIGESIQNHTVYFKVVKGNAKLDENKTEVSKLTDKNGFAGVRVTLNTTVDSSIIEASALRLGNHITSSPDSFLCWSLPLEAENMVLHGGNNQTGAAGSTLAEPLSVKVTDKYGNAVVGTDITFTVTEGGGNIEGQSFKKVPSDGQGLASVNFTIGTDDRVTNKCVATGKKADGTAFEPITFQATGGKVEKMELVSGNNQEGSAGYLLDSPVVIKVLDNYGNVVPDFEGLEFHVAKGSGLIGTTKDTIIATGSDGKANCNYRMSYTPGKTDTIKVLGYQWGSELTGSPLYIYAKSRPASDYQRISPDKIYDGTAGEVLSDSIKTKVIDNRGYILKYFPITYAVTAGGGKVNDQDAVVVKTNAEGEAAVAWKMGSEAGTKNNLMEGRAYYNGSQITHSPLVYTASAKLGHASLLTISVDADSQASVVGNYLENPIKVQVTDMAGNPIVGHKVTYKILTGSGTINGLLASHDSYTGANGYCEVQWKIGNDKGWVNSMLIDSRYESTHLQGSPDTLWAYGTASDAANLVAKSSTTINGTVGEPLSQPFMVQVTDRNGNGVEGIQVYFEVTAGGGTLNGDSLKSTVIPSDANGYSQATLTVGPKVGIENIVEVSASNGAIVLTGSPITFKSVGEPGPVSLEVSEIVCDPDGSENSPLKAGETATVIVLLKDAQGNPPNQQYLINLAVEGDGATITEQPSDVSDELGRAVGKVTSSKSGLKYVTAEILTTGRPKLVDKGEVRFGSLDADHVGPKIGDNQTGNVNAALPNPIGITVQDKYDNPVPNWEVTFTPGTGGTQVLETQPVMTDSNGQALTTMVMGPNTGSGTVNATVHVIEKEATFTATAVDNPARYLEIYSGDEATGVAGVELPEPLVVKVTDAQKRPVYNHLVQYEVQIGEGSFSGSQTFKTRTDANGLASANYTLDKSIGKNYVRVQSPELYSQYSEFVNFSLEGIGGEARVINMVSGDGTSGSVYGTSPYLQVQTTDYYGNGVSDVEVTFSVVEGDASIEQSQPVTSGSEGYASSRVRFTGTMGPVVVEAAAEGLVNSPITFTVYATAAAAKTMEIAGGNNQNGTIGKKLAFPFEVIIYDEYQNPVKGAPVYWTVKSGSGTLTMGGGNFTTYSDEDGIASNYLKLGPNAGTNRVDAFNNNLSGDALIFTAEGVTNNFPVITTIGDQSITENQSLSFTVEASDGDNDPLTYGLLSELPSGATYDSLGTQTFSWKPGFTQAGEYKLWFVAYDNNDGVGAELVKISVQNQNRPPVKKFSYPTTYYVSADYGTDQRIDFMISATDEDSDDKLKYFFYLRNMNLKVPDSILVSTSDVFNYYAGEHPIGPYRVTVHVTDSYDTLTTSWWVSNKDAVELSLFSAKVVKNKDVQLEWETSYEYNSVGFNILRSTERYGDYKRLTAVPVSTNAERKYSYLDQTVQTGRTYFYRLEDVESSGRQNLHDPIEVEISRPKEFALLQNYPNPFNPDTQIQYQLPEPADVKLVIFNIRGQIVRKLVQDSQDAGYHAAIWDGRNDAGLSVASGIYFYVLQTPKFKQAKRMLLLK